MFFVGYFVAYEPYRALYPDAVGEEAAGRAQATQAVWRGAGTGLALVGGGLLLGLGQGAPFLSAAAVYVASIALFTLLLMRRGVPRPDEGDRSVREELRRLWALVRRERVLQAFLIANARWELSLAALKTFVVLYVTAGLGFSRSNASLIIGGVAVIVLLAALGSGRLADRCGATRVMTFALPIHGLGFLVPLLFSAKLLGGLAIGAAGSYQTVWRVCAAAVLVSLIPLRRVAARSRG